MAIVKLDDFFNSDNVSERNLFLSEDVKQFSMRDIIEKIIKFNEEDNINERIEAIKGNTYTRQPINIYCDSYGGDVYAGLGLISVIEKSETPVYTYVTGSAMSMGFMILMSGHKRHAYKYSTGMYHQVSSGIWDKYENIKIEVKEIERLQKLLEKITIEKTGLTAKKLDEIRNHKIDWYLTAEDMLKYNIVDEILN